jgi:hypothetical protein
VVDELSAGQHARPVVRRAYRRSVATAAVHRVRRHDTARRASRVATAAAVCPHGSVGCAGPAGADRPERLA